MTQILALEDYAPIDVPMDNMIAEAFIAELSESL
jgi:hypothetical protein